MGGPAGDGSNSDLGPAGLSGRRQGQARAFGGRFAAAVAVGRVVLPSWLRRQTAAIARPVPLAMLVAGGFMVAVLGIAAAVRVPPSADLTSVGAMGSLPPEARITGMRETKWREGTPAPELFDPLPAGTMLELEAGLVEIRYECGATVLLEGPAVFGVEGRTESRLALGRLTARLDSSAKHDRTKHGRSSNRQRGAFSHASSLHRLFTIHTPRASVHDLGTEFGVEVRKSGDADVHVFDGLVEMASVGHPGVANAVANEVPLRLGAGESVKIDEAGRIAASGAAAPSRFVRSLPQPKAGSKSILEQIGWNDAAAVVICRDTFVGEGPLAGATPSSRGGIGSAAWNAPRRAWELRDGSLCAESAGSALLPFRPEPGWLYRLTVSLEVVAGGDNWCAFGFRTDGNSSSDFRDGGFAWTLQRHSSTVNGSHVLAGPGATRMLTKGDRRTGLQTRSVVLDTTGPKWKALFLVGKTPVASCHYSTPPVEISHVGVSIHHMARARVDSFVIERAVKYKAAEPNGANGLQEGGS